MHRKYLEVSETAALLGCSDFEVVDWISRGYLPGVSLEDHLPQPRYVVHRDSVLRAVNALQRWRREKKGSDLEQFWHHYPV